MNAANLRLRTQRILFFDFSRLDIGTARAS